jgi:hypothetical protein
MMSILRWASRRRVTNCPTMSWNIANAKWQFSELVRLSAQEPQPVYNRARQVAVVISAEEFAARAAQRPTTSLIAGISRSASLRRSSAWRRFICAT